MDGSGGGITQISSGSAHQLTIVIHAVADLEMHLLFQEPWAVELPQFKDTIKYIHQHQYHWALDKLEQLVVQQLFELSKVNVLGMGKLQPITYITWHIAILSTTF